MILFHTLQTPNSSPFRVGSWRWFTSCRLRVWLTWFSFTGKHGYWEFRILIAVSYQEESTPLPLPFIPYGGSYFPSVSSSAMFPKLCLWQHCYIVAIFLFSALWLAMYNPTACYQLHKEASPTKVESCKFFVYTLKDLHGNLTSRPLVNITIIGFPNGLMKLEQWAVDNYHTRCEIPDIMDLLLS